jgi:hypothetical protein
MSDGFIIEIDDLAAGILVREGGSYCFHAAADRFFDLQGRRFDGPIAAEYAARKLLRGVRRQMNAVRPWAASAAGI